VEITMRELTLRAVHPTETREVASLSARFLSSLVIALAGILLFTPFVVHYFEH
jgi:hypothetical protein